MWERVFNDAESLENKGGDSIWKTGSRRDIQQQMIEISP